MKYYQNILVRKYLERKAAAKIEEEKHADNDEGNQCDKQENVSTGNGTVSVQPGKQDLDAMNQVKEKVSDNNEVEVRRGFFTKRRNNAVEARHATTQKQNVVAVSKAQDCESSSRPAFCSALHGQATSNTKLQPRAVAIPYSRFRKERFYDWPPDPTVSRATPILLHTVNTDNDDDSLSSIPDIPVSDHEDEDVLDSSIRENHKGTEKSPTGIPEFIMF